MSKPVRAGISEHGELSTGGHSAPAASAVPPVKCRQHSVAVTCWADYAYYCPTHDALIAVELTDKRSA